LITSFIDTGGKFIADVNYAGVNYAGGKSFPLPLRTPKVKKYVLCLHLMQMALKENERKNPALVFLI